MAMSDAAWPLYFAAQDIKGKKFVCKKGDLLPWVDKRIIRGLGQSLGVQNYERLPFGELPFVKILNLRSAAMERTVRTQGLNYAAAQKLAEQGEAA